MKARQKSLIRRCQRWIVKMRMRYIRVINKMKEYPEVTIRLGIKDNSYIKKICGDMALKVIVNGCYYGYLVEHPTSIVI